MVKPSQRMALRLTTVIMLAAMLAACGKNSDAPPREPPPPAMPATPPQPSAPAAQAEPAPGETSFKPGSAPADQHSTQTLQQGAGNGPIKVAFAYVGPVGDGGWSYAQDSGRRALEKALGDQVVTKYVESVPESADAERIFRGFAQEGNQLIFGTSFGYMDYMVRVARDYPNTRFDHAAGYKTAPNLGTYDSRTYQGAYMAGIVAGAMTKSNILGVVGSVPIPEVLRNINSFTLGAQSVNPAIRTRVVWVNQWFNPPLETEAATSLINSGADILFQNTDSAAVIRAAQEQGKRAFGWNSDMTQYGPQAHLASAVINWGPYYIKTAQSVIDGTWKSEKEWWGVKEGAIDLVGLADDVPQETRERVEQVRQGLRDGSFHIWTGPIESQDGKEVLAKDQTADDNFLLGIRFYVRGVEGQPPGI